MKQVVLVKTIDSENTYLAPLKSEIKERNEVMHKPIRPATTSGGMKTEAAEAEVSIMLGIKLSSSC